MRIRTKDAILELSRIYLLHTPQGLGFELKTTDGVTRWCFPKERLDDRTELDDKLESLLTQGFVDLSDYITIIYAGDNFKTVAEKRAINATLATINEA